ncbi:hypothetical protein [Prevotella denticola]
MKRKKKKVSILSLLALAAVLFTACATDDAETDRQNPKQKPDTTGLTAFSVNNEVLPADPTSPTTRVAGEYTGTGIKFYWTEGDKIGVEIEADPVTHRKVFQWDDRNDIEKQLEASGKDRTARAKFWFSGEYTAPQYPVRYVGNLKYPYFYCTNIENKQEQTKPNDAAELGKYGDCGTGTAYSQADGHYAFMIDHKASYVTFLPYTLQKGVARAKIEKIKVTADKAVCGQFDFNENGIDLSSRPATTDDNNHIELTLDNFSIPLTAPNADANAAIMVIAPGTYSKFTVEYSLHEHINYPDGGTDARGTITKEYKNVTFTAGKNKIISQNLEVPEYPADTYYMWDAAVGQHYWKGYEWNSAIPEQDPFFKGNRTHYPKDNKDPRWHREFPLDLAPGSSLEATRSCKDCPNANELCWYVAKGDAHWVESLWVCMDHLYAGGVWLKKLSVIAQENGKSISDLKNAAPDGKDYRTQYLYPLIRNTTTDVLPDKIDDYFFLPALGFYDTNGNGGPGGLGYYWSSTPWCWWGDNTLPHYFFSAHCLYFFRTTIMAHSLNVGTGMQLWPANR